MSDLSRGVHRRTRYMALRIAPALMLSSLSAAALAQTTSPQPPTAGTLLQQIAPDATPQLPQTIAPVIAPMVRPAAPVLEGGLAFEVKAFRLSGISPERAQALLPLLEPHAGAGKTLHDLEDAAKDVEVELQRQGLFLAQVCVPEQKLADGVVTLQVYEGQLGNVALDVAPGVKVATAYMNEIVAPLRGNPRVERELIERVLFTLSDLRGITVTSALTPGAQVGVADLTIKVSAAAPDATVLEYDNAGSVFTGRNRVYGNFDWFNLANRGDIASLKTQFSSGSEYIRGSWLTPVNTQGTKVGVQVSALQYQLGTPLFEPLDAEGHASTIGIMALHPLVRSRNNNVFLQASLETRSFVDEVQSIGLSSKKGVTVYGNLGVVGDFRDTLWGGGITNYAAQLVVGNLKIDTPSEAALDASTYHTAGNYAKVVLSASRLQALPNKDFLFLGVQAQAANKNLDSSEKLNLGGLYGVRGYPSPESPSDAGVVLSWEYRKPLNTTLVPGDLVFSVFGDYGVARLHQSPLPSDIENSRRIMSHGIALTHSNNGLTVRAALAFRGNSAAQSDDQHTRFLLQVSKAL